MRNILIISFLLLTISVNAQIKYGIYGGFNFPGVSTDLSNVRGIPIDKGGASFTLGIHGNTQILPDIEIESGLNLNNRGYTFETIDSWGVPYDNFNRFTMISVPVTAMYYIVGDDDFGNRWEDFRVGAGLGLYAGYLLNGKITDEDGNTTAATFSNMNRIDYGARLMFKTLFGHFEGFFVAEFGLRNAVKTGSALIRQNTLMIGVGYQF